MKDLKLLKEIKKSHQGAVRSLRYLPGYLNDKLVLVSGGDDGVVQTWQRGFLNTLSSSKFLGHHGSILDIDCFSEPPLFVSTATDGKVFLKSLAEDKNLVVLDSFKEFPSNVKIEPKDWSFISLARTANYSVVVLHIHYGVFLWNLQRGALLQYPSPELPIYGAKVITSERRNFIITNSGKSIYILQRSTGEIIRVFGGSPKGVRKGNQLLFVGEEDNLTSQVFENMGGHKADVTCLALSTDENFLISGSQDCTIHRWDISDPSLIESKGVKIMEGHRGIITSVSFIPNSKTVASCSVDGTLRLWDSEINKELFQMNLNTPVYAMSISFDGKELAVGGGNGSIYIFDLQKP
jgi:WD40 repeat protein